MRLLPYTTQVHASHRDDAFAGGIAMLAVFVIIIGLWLAVTILNIIVRAFVQHPKNKALWVGVGLVVASLLSVILMQGKSISMVFVGLSILVLALIAKFVDLYGTKLLQEQTNTLDKVLRRSWWTHNPNNTLPNQKAA